MGVLDFRKNTGPPNIWNLPWDLFTSAEFGDQPAQPKDCTLVGQGEGGSGERILSSQSIQHIQQDLCP